MPRDRLSFAAPQFAKRAAGRRIASITAIVIGVLYLKNLNPGPMIFHNQPELVVFIVFFLANILMVPFGWLAIKASVHVLRVPRLILMPIIMMFCTVGAFSITNSVF